VSLSECRKWNHGTPRPSWTTCPSIGATEESATQDALWQQDNIAQNAVKARLN